MEQSSCDGLSSWQAHAWCNTGKHRCSCCPGSSSIWQLRLAQHVLHLPRRLLQHSCHWHAMQLEIRAQHARRCHNLRCCRWHLSWYC